MDRMISGLSLVVQPNRLPGLFFMVSVLPVDVARLQSLFAFSGSGFTTGETESVVDTPARRRVVSMLIRLGKWAPHVRNGEML